MLKRLTALTALVALVAITAGSSATSAAVNASSATTPRCATSALEVWLGLGEGGAATGSSYYPLEFTNVSERSCHMVGYPGVSAYDGRQLGSAARRAASSTENVITLRPGATAHALLQITDVSALPATTCKPTKATELRVFPPNDFRAAFISFRFRACSLSGPTFLSVNPMRAHVGVPGHVTP